MCNDLNIPQDDATLLYDNNAAAIAMANISCPTIRTRHMDNKYFALLDWVSTDQLMKQYPRMITLWMDLQSPSGHNCLPGTPTPSLANKNLCIALFKYIIELHMYR